MIRPEFWNGKRVFLTGHTGFKGAWMSLLLAKLGAQVTGYSLPPETSPSLFELSGGAQAVHAHVTADIRDQAALTDVMQRAKPEIVIHMAAQALVRRSYRDPAETFDVNVMGTAYLLEAIGKTPEARAVIIVTTDKVYDLSAETCPRRETDALGGHDPYSASKAAAEILVQSWRQSFFGARPNARPAAIATARSGNVIGGGDWSQDRIAPDLVAALSAGRDVELRYPDSVRPWLYVLDSLTGYLMLAERLHADADGFAEAWNFGPLAGEEMCVREVVSLFAQEWGSRGGWRMADGPQPAEAPLLRLDPSKAVDQLGWRPSLSQAEAIREAAAWYRAFLTQEADAVNLSHTAIERHLLRISQAKPAAF